MVSALLYSGGLDAYCIDQLFNPDTRIFVDSGTEEALEEQRMLASQGVDVTYVDLTFLTDFEKENKIIPFRNAFFIMVGAMYADEVWLGATYGDGRDTVDTDPAFRSLSEAVLNKFHEPDQAPDGVTPPFEVKYPAYDYTKGELVKEVVQNGGSAREVAEKSKSCHHGDMDKGCGVCLGCVRRFVALGYGAMYDTECRVLDMVEYFKNDPRAQFTEKEVFDNMKNRGREYRQFQEVVEYCDTQTVTEATESI